MPSAEDVRTAEARIAAFQRELAEALEAERAADFDGQPTDDWRKVRHQIEDEIIDLIFGVTGVRLTTESDLTTVDVRDYLPGGRCAKA